METYPTRAWRRLNGQYYRTIPLYPFETDLSPEPIAYARSIYAISQAGGFIATAARPSEIM